MKKRAETTGSRWLALSAACLSLSLFSMIPSPCRADTADGAESPCSLCPSELAFRFLYGHGDKASLDFYSFGPRLAFDLLPSIIPPIAGNRVRLAVELLGSVIQNSSTEHELAFSPLIFDYRYDAGGPVVPFFEGGEGLLYTSLSHINIGGHFQFSSQIGGGIHLFFTHQDAVTIGGRYRHISNAGIRSPNSGLNTYFLTLGWSRFPYRQ
jgi:lipid A 3-O-deacylase PagL